jgi:hypothetical protein
VPVRVACSAAAHSFRDACLGSVLLALSPVSLLPDRAAATRMFFGRTLFGLALIAGVVHVFRKDITRIASVLRKPTQQFLQEVKKELGDAPRNNGAAGSPVSAAPPAPGPAPGPAPIRTVAAAAVPAAAPEAAHPPAGAASGAPSAASEVKGPELK